MTLCDTSGFVFRYGSYKNSFVAAETRNRPGAEPRAAHPGATLAPHPEESSP